MRFRVAFVAALAFGMLANPGGLQALEAQAASPDDFPDEIEVLSQREMAKALFKENLEALTAPIKVTDVIPRFFQPLCLEVAGLEPSQSKYVIDRITGIASEVGLGAPAPGCRTNALVIVVDDPERMFEKLVSKRLDMVGILPFRDVHVRRIRDALRGKQPVVWWNLLRDASTEGATLNDLGLAVTSDIGASRLTSTFQQSKALSVVMYDANQLGGATLAQIADHAALHLLGTPRRQIDFNGVDLRTMLSLFNEGPEAGPEGLTDFDRAYLKGLYRLGSGAFQTQVPGAVVAAYSQHCEGEQSDCRIQLRK